MLRLIKIETGSSPCMSVKPGKHTIYQAAICIFEGNQTTICVCTIWWHLKYIDNFLYYFSFPFQVGCIFSTSRTYLWWKCGAQIQILVNIWLFILCQSSTDQSTVDTDIPYRVAGLIFALIQLLCIIILMSQVGWPVLVLFIIILAISIWYQASQIILMIPWFLIEQCMQCHAHYTMHSICVKDYNFIAELLHQFCQRIS